MLSSTVIRYLLTIYRLSPDNRPIPSVFISRQLNVTRSSVAKTLSQLTEENLVEKAHYGRLACPLWAGDWPSNIKENNRLSIVCLSNWAFLPNRRNKRP